MLVDGLAVTPVKLRSRRLRARTAADEKRRSAGRRAARSFSSFLGGRTPLSTLEGFCYGPHGRGARIARACAPTRAECSSPCPGGGEPLDQVLSAGGIGLAPQICLATLNGGLLTGGLTRPTRNGGSNRNCARPRARLPVASPHRRRRPETLTRCKLPGGAVSRGPISCPLKGRTG